MKTNRMMRSPSCCDRVIIVVCVTVSPKLANTLLRAETEGPTPTGVTRCRKM